MKELDITPWLIRMRQGDDEEAFRLLYESTRDYAHGLIYYLTPNKQDVGDIMSEVYMELLKCLDNYQQDQKFISWFNGLVVRQVRNWNRRGWRRFRILERLKSVAYEPPDQRMEDRLSALSDQLELIPLLEGLPQKYKEVIVLRYYQDASLEEIAEQLQIPLGTVKSRHHHVLKHLRHRLGQADRVKEKTEYVH